MGLTPRQMELAGHVHEFVDTPRSNADYEEQVCVDCQLVRGRHADEPEWLYWNW